MDLKEKVEAALERYFHADRVRLENDEGISGYVVSTQFQKMPALDRQTAIYDALRKSSVPLSKAEIHQVLAIAALTPAEYEALGYSEGGSRR